MVMPGDLDGLALAEKLQREKPSLKVIIASGYSEDMVEQVLADKQNGRFLQKPYLPRALAGMVRQALD
jgi:DNA-binding NtrC family response regulator